MGHARIEDYALIGDCESAALVGRDGSIDWLCWPRFDSAACFAALLGTVENGRWKLAPAKAFEARRRYRPETLILETEFETDTGAVTLVDFMPVRGTQSDLVRTLVGRRGRVAMEMELVLRFDYGASVPWVTRFAEGKGIRAISGPDKVVLCAPVPLENRDMRTRARFEVEAGQTLSFVLTYGPSHLEIPSPVDPSRAPAFATDIRRYYGDGADGAMIRDGNSIFIFEVAGLCIGHLGHLHHKLDDTHFAAIGRLDIVMVPIDGTYTMSLDGVSEITKRLRSAVVLPMHRFATPLDEFMRLIGQQFVIDQRSERTLKISRDTLPGTPTVIILDGV